MNDFVGPPGAPGERFDVFRLDRVIEVRRELLLLRARPRLIRHLTVRRIAAFPPQPRSVASRPTKQRWRIEERLEQVAARNRAYAHALYRAVLADAHCDARIEALVTRRRLRAAIDALLAPLVRDGQV